MLEHSSESIRISIEKTNTLLSFLSTGDNLEEQEWFQNLVENINDGFGLLDRDFAFTYMNRNFCRLLGYERNDLLGHQVTEYMDEENQSKMLRQQELRKNGTKDPFELAWQTKKGVRIYTRVAPTPIFNKQKEFLGSFAIVSDITKIKKKEENFQKNNLQLEHLVSSRNEELERKNIALQEILSQIASEKKQLNTKISANVENIILPIIKKLKISPTLIDYKYIELLETKLADLSSTFGLEISSSKFNLTPREIQISGLIKDGFSNKEISEFLNLSVGTIEAHRNNVRKKLGIVSSGKNLAVYLRSL